MSCFLSTIRRYSSVYLRQMDTPFSVFSLDTPIICVVKCRTVGSVPFKCGYLGTVGRIANHLENWRANALTDLTCSNPGIPGDPCSVIIYEPIAQIRIPAKRSNIFVLLAWNYGKSPFVQQAPKESSKRSSHEASNP